MLLRASMITLWETTVWTVGDRGEKRLGRRPEDSSFLDSGFGVLTTRIAVCENENAIGSTKMCDWQRVLQRSRLLVVRLRAFSLLLFCGGSWACVRACVICKARAASVAGVLRQSGSPLATDMSSSYTHMCCVVSTNFRAKERLVTVFLRSWVTHLAKHPLREIPAAHFEKLPGKKNSVFVWRCQSRER